MIIEMIQGFIMAGVGGFILMLGFNLPLWYPIFTGLTCALLIGVVGKFIQLKLQSNEKG